MVTRNKLKYIEIRYIIIEIDRSVYIEKYISNY